LYRSNATLSTSIADSFLRHVEIQHFAIQEWKANGDIFLEHISGILNPSDDLTAPLGWVLHSRHARHMMGHYRQ
jgi:hypothetical protein